MGKSNAKFSDVPPLTSPAKFITFIAVTFSSQNLEICRGVSGGVLRELSIRPLQQQSESCSLVVQHKDTSQI